MTPTKEDTMRTTTITSERKLSFLILGLLAIGILLTGCGSVGSGSAGLTASEHRGVHISCLDVTYSAAAGCAGTPVSLKPLEARVVYPLAALPYRAVYNAGLINSGVAIWAMAEVTNNSLTNVDIYFYTEFNKGGVFSGNTAETYKINVGPGVTIDADYGSSPCHDPGSCPVPEYWEYVTYVYNASHLPHDSVHGDPAIDQILAIGTLKFTLKANP